MILISYEVRQYRKLLDGLVKKGSIVIEIGPHTGASTKQYLKKAGLVIAVDKADQSMEKFGPMLKENPNLKFVQGDVRDFSTIEKVMKLTKKCDVLAVDMGGGRYPDTVFKVWAVWSGIFRPKNTLIRNRGLGEFIMRSKISDDYLKRKFDDTGWLETWGRAMPYALKKQMKEFRHWVDINRKFE